MTPNAENDARCSRCDEVVGTMVTEGARATIRLSTNSHGTDLPITCPNVIRRSVNGHTLELRATYWRCLQCDHRFENAADAEGFWCGDDCTGKHHGESGHPAGKNEGHAVTPVWTARDQGAPRRQTRVIPPGGSDA